MKKLHVYLLICILLFAALVRFAYIIERAGAPLSGDEPSYDSIAWNLATGHGYKLGDPSRPQNFTAKRGPSYILFLALIYRVAGHRIGAVLAAQALLDALCCLLAFNICRLLFGRRSFALAAAALYAVYLPFALSTSSMMTETFTNVTVMLAISAFLQFFQEQKRSALYVSAIAIGLATLNKPVLALLPIAFFAVVYRSMPRAEWLKGLGVQLALVALLMTPWIVRNAVTFHAFIPTVTQGGITLWRGTDPAHRGQGYGTQDLPDYVIERIQGLSELERDKWFYREGIQIIKSDPKTYAILLLKKIPRLWFNLKYWEAPSRTSLLFAFGNLVFIILAVMGIVACKPPRHSVNLLLLLALYFTVVHIPFDPVARFSLPVYAYMLCFSASGLVFIMQRVAPLDSLLIRLDIGEKLHSD